jgi:SAM-dependent methyltransferase
VTEPAKSFDGAAREYERGRPGWPVGVLDVVPVPESATVLDLGAGTGKLTRVLVERYARVVAVEPLSALREILADRVPAAEVLKGTAEEIPRGDASVDAVFVAQAFHWFANHAAVEIGRVLHPGGVLAILWNEPNEDLPSPLPPAYRRRLDELQSDTPPPPADPHEFIAGGPFGDVQSAVVEHEQVSDRAGGLAFAASVSWVASRDDRKRVLAELAELLPPGEYRFPMCAHIRWATRR